MYRKIILCVAVVCCAIMANAQGAYDALRYSQQQSEGTARSVAMGNAFTALGGDIGAFSINPASSAVYRYSEIVLTPSLTTSITNSEYLGYSQDGSKVRGGIANFGFVGAFETGRKNAGLVSWSLGLAFNKQSNFTNARNIYGRTDVSSKLGAIAYGLGGLDYTELQSASNDPDRPFYESAATWEEILAWQCYGIDTLPGMRNQYIAATENLDGYDISTAGELAQKFKSISTGNITEAAINWGGNFANKLFVGVNLGIQSINYKYEERYAEEALNSSEFQVGFESYNTYYRYKATGSAINLKAGLIYLPTKWLRVGAAISTPTWMFIKEEWENAAAVNFDYDFSSDLSSPLGTYNYRLNTPFRWNVGLAATLGAFGVISADYESVDYSNAKLRDADYSFGYEVENSDIKQLLGKQNIVRLGAEINLHPQWALRGGYQFYSSPYADGSKDDNINIGSVGFGYVKSCGSSGDFFVDLTYQQMLKKSVENFSLYDDTDIMAPVGVSKNNQWKLLVSFGFRF